MTFEEQKIYEKMLDAEISKREKEALKKLGAVGKLLTTHTPRRKSAADVYSAYAYGKSIKIVYYKTPCAKPKAAARVAVENEENDAKRATAEGRRQNNLSRARSRVFELATCNEFTHFCTFTLDKKKKDRYDLSGFRKDLSMMVRNINRGRAEEYKIKYLMIPEKHKDGAYHLHGLFMGFCPGDLQKFTLSQRLPKQIRDQLEQGESVYNWESYAKSFGYFTATEIKDKTATAKYITKYITKEMGAAVDKEGGHLFYASQGLKGRKTLCWREVWDYTIDNDKWDYENEYIKVKWIYP